MTDVGVYVHVPFCERICPYCDFAVVAARRLAPEQERDYVETLLLELEQRRADFAGRGLASLYFGGHLSRSGNAIVADELARWLREHGFP